MTDSGREVHIVTGEMEVWMDDFVKEFCYGRCFDHGFFGEMFRRPVRIWKNL